MFCICALSSDTPANATAPRFPRPWSKKHKIRIQQQQAPSSVNHMGNNSQRGCWERGEGVSGGCPRAGGHQQQQALLSSRFLSRGGMSDFTASFMPSLFFILSCTFCTKQVFLVGFPITEFSSVGNFKFFVKSTQFLPLLLLYPGSQWCVQGVVHLGKVQETSARQRTHKHTPTGSLELPINVKGRQRTTTTHTQKERYAQFPVCYSILV